MSDWPEFHPKSIGTIKVGKDRYFWMVYRRGAYADAGYRTDHFAMDDANPNWIDGEGFTITLETAVAAARQVADNTPGPMAKTSPRQAGKSGDRYIRQRYSEFYARKSKLSDTTDARPIGMLGSLWQRSYSSLDDCFDWTEWTVTKITQKRIFARPRMAYRWEEYGKPKQKSFDRITLQNEGELWSDAKMFYTEAGKAREEEYQRELHETEGAPGAAPSYPRLGVSRTASRTEVLVAFRRLAKTAHPDQGGDADAFRELVAERDMALRGPK